MLYIYKVSRLEDFQAFYELKCQKDAVAWSGFATAPNEDRLREYFVNKILKNDKTYVFYLRDTEIPDETCIGYQQFDLNEDGVVDMRGTVIRRKYQGLGYYDEIRILVEDEIARLGGKTIISWCSELNSASMNGAEDLGWHKTNEFNVVNLPKLGGDHKFYKWIKEIK